MKKLAEILTGPDVWCKGARAFNGRMCLLGALSQLLHCQPRGWVSRSDTEYQRLLKIIDLPDNVGIAFWNDHPDRTWEEVASVVEAYDRDRMLHP